MGLRVCISERGAIVLGEHVVADGHDSGKLLRVLTHIHQDHLVDLDKSVREIPLVAATPLTLDALEVLGYRIPPSKRLPLPLHSPVKLEAAKVVLLHSTHVPGSAQVLVEYDSGFRVGYTGDFKMPTPVMDDLDVLVLEATYGHPSWVRPWQEEIDYLLADIVAEALSKGPVHIYAYHGKAQEVMLLLRRHGIAAPFIASSKVFELAKIVEKHGLKIGEVFREGSLEAREIARGGWYVYFTHSSRWYSRRLVGPRGNGAPLRPTHVLLTGWEFQQPYRKSGEDSYIVSYSDHADFKQLVEYVESAKPRLLIVDGYRSVAAEAFASYVSKKLGLKVLVQPQL